MGYPALCSPPQGGQYTAIIFWLKTRAHWREQTAEGAIANPDTGSNSEVVPVCATTTAISP